MDLVNGPSLLLEKSDLPTTFEDGDSSKPPLEYNTTFFFEKNKRTGIVTVRFSNPLTDSDTYQQIKEQLEPTNQEIKKKCNVEVQNREDGWTWLVVKYEDPIWGRSLGIQDHEVDWHFDCHENTNLWVQARCSYDPKKVTPVGKEGKQDNGGNEYWQESSTIFVTDKVLGWLPLKSIFEIRNDKLLLKELDKKRGSYWEQMKGSFTRQGYNDNLAHGSKPIIGKLEGHGDLQEVRVVAIGPYHHHLQDKGKLHVTTEMKWQIVACLQKLCLFDWKSYFSAIKRDENNLWRFYESQNIKMDRKSFREMLLLDGCFLIFVFIIFEGDRLWHKVLEFEKYKIKKYNPDSLMLISLEHMRKEKIMNFAYENIVRKAEEIKLDLLMYDNQIPFNVIQCVPCENLKRFIQCSIEKLVLQSFNDIYPPMNPEYMKKEPPKNFYHVLHLFHWSRIPSSRYHQNSLPLKLAGAIPSASELHRSGLFFHHKRSGSSLDVMFSQGLWGAFKLKGILNVPNICITDYTKYVLHTLMIFEQRYPNNYHSRDPGFCVTSYLASVVQLIQSEHDVQLFRRVGIFANTSKTDKEVLGAIQGMDLNQLTEKGPIEDSTQPMPLKIKLPNETYDLFKKIRGHHGWKWSIRYGEFVQNYCANTWITLSVVAAILLFFFTGLQAAYSVMSYHFPKKQ